MEVHPESGRTPAAKLTQPAASFSAPSRYCPSEKLTPLAREITASKSPGYGEVAAISEFVHGRLAYRYGVSDSSTNALETLQAGAGVCRDFAHVAISLCRSIEIPARMVAGYLYDRAPLDLHAWLKRTSAGAGTRSIPPKTRCSAAASSSRTAATPATWPS